MTNRIVAIALAAAIALPGAAFAGAKIKLTDANKAQIAQLLTEQGYQVGKIRIEDGLYEAYAKKDGGRFEVMLDGDFQIVKIKG